MSKSDKTASAEGQDELQSGSVLDILYHDVRRVGAFLSQFDDSGFLQQVIQRESVTKGKKRGFKWAVGGGASVLGTGGSGNLGFERGPGEQGSEGADRIYDPFWTNTLTLLDFLEGAELIQPDLPGATIGRFVKVSGSLRIHDLATLKKLWDLPSVKSTMRIGMKSSRKKGGTGLVSDNQLGFEILQNLPHGVLARIEDKRGRIVWSSLNEGGLSGPASDLFLKHGVRIAGDWTMVGILDAQPDQDDEQPMLTDEESQVQVLTMGFSYLLESLGPPARQFLGRPSSAYGVTPLVIYREVSG